jgi:hypothetical protein
VRKAIPQRLKPNCRELGMSDLKVRPPVPTHRSQEEIDATRERRKQEETP